MNTNIDIRLKMLEPIKTSLEDGSADHKIVFKDSSTTLAEIVFKELELLSNEVEYIFKAIDDTTSLRATVVESGRVTSFTIQGMIPSAVPALGTALDGTVGALNSMADIKFNQRDWEQGGIITLNSLRIFLKQGT